MKLDEAKDILLKEGYLLEDNSDIMNNFFILVNLKG